MIERRTFFQLPGRTVALVLAGGRGSRLYELTDRRAKPAVYFGGKYRIVDFAMSNCVNSGIRRIGVVTQYKSHSLLRHIQRGWGFLRGENNEFVDLLPAQQRVDEESWYRGTADAVYQNIDILETYHPTPQYVLILAGDHVYKMNYAAMLVDHAESGAECSVACIEVPRQDAKGFGVMAVDSGNRVTDFVEKPADPPPMPGKPDSSLCSMGIYIFNAKYLYNELMRDIADPTSSHDFGKDIIPRAVRNGVAYAHPFDRSCVHAPEEGPNKENYWRDAGTVDAYWEANIDLTATTPALNLYDTDWPIWTHQEQLPPAKFVFDDEDRRGMAVDSMVSGGCIISGATVRHSLLFSNVVVNDGAMVTDSVILPNVTIGEGARVRKAVLDKGCEIPAGMVIGEDLALDRERFEVSEGGVVLVTPEMLNQQLHFVR